MEVIENTDKKEIIFTLNDESTHDYMYDENSNSIFFIVKEEDGTEKKYITLCENLDNCNFQFEEENNIVKTNIKIDEILYNNNFKIEI